MFELDFSKVIIWLLPRKVRTVFNVLWLKVLISPVLKLYNSLITYRSKVHFQLNYNGQVCYLEGVLNDTFDISERRIYLTDAGGEAITLLNRDTDGDDLMMTDDSDSNVSFIHNDSAYDGGEYDFIVNTPYEFSKSDKYRLKALVNFYKLAGKRYYVIVNTNQDG